MIAISLPFLNQNTWHNCSMERYTEIPNEIT